MNVPEIICNKRDGKKLENNQIEHLISGYASEKVPDYQMSAFAMAVFFQGMDLEETTTLTRCMVESGEKLQWHDKVPSVDKHSTGGIGDKISIPLAPLLACCGVEVPMISGRGLGTTGGTLDKLESIPGYRCEVTPNEFRGIINWNGCSIASASKNIAPADNRLYALRDVTGTVPSIPLITASILSKKIAAGIDALVLDVKFGSGAFMKTLDEARELAQSLVSVSQALGVKTSALITDMNQPLGRMVGNAVEINESIDILQNNGPEDATQLTIELGAKLLSMAGTTDSLDSARQMLRQKIENGEGLKRLTEMVKSHGGDLSAARPVGKDDQVRAPQSGFISRINADRLGLAVIEMGGGRKKLGDVLDHSSGIEILVKIGDEVNEGQTIANIFCNTPVVNYARELVGAAITISDQQPERSPLIVETIG